MNSVQKDAKTMIIESFFFFFAWSVRVSNGKKTATPASFSERPRRLEVLDCDTDI